MSKTAETEQSDSQSDENRQTTTLAIDDRGRGTLPIDVRRELGVDGQKATLEVTVDRVITTSPADNRGDAD